MPAELFLPWIFPGELHCRATCVLKLPSNGLCLDLVRCVLHERLPLAWKCLTLAMEVMRAAGAQEMVQKSR